mmetsp:Transcript_14584/g.31601  ORF Transcript_14584/g.31601 Transcript_14584/m.31601 type:complete len:597 (+) Transcript_14584:113-1903(+)
MRYAAALMLGALADTGAESAAGHTWVPIRVSGGATTYFNPETNALKKELPAGGKAAPVVNFLDLQQPEPIGMDADAEDPDIPVAQSQTSSSSVASITAATAAQVEESDAKSCYPQCTWNCTKPVCNQDCKPECEQPTCQTRCPKPDYSKCKIDCDTPRCSVMCPKDPCHSTPGVKCSSPKCSTQCAKAVCSLKCSNHVPCSNVCHSPRCSWNCKNPTVCPKPECHLACERPLGCAQTYQLPPLSPAQSVQQQFTADRARWVVYDWGTCSERCGKGYKTRKVLCSTGQDEECQFGRKPPTEEVCDTQCEKWMTSEWDVCSAVCGKGTTTRKVWCSNEDEKECFGEKPNGTKKCVDDGDHCTHCTVELFGGRYHTGWKAKLQVGDYTTEDLVKAGVQCEDVSSMKVHGACCHAHAFQYGDFNQQSKGWSAHLKIGSYDADALEDVGVQDNDVSSLKVQLGECRQRVRKYDRIKSRLERAAQLAEPRAAAMGWAGRTGNKAREAAEEAQAEDESVGPNARELARTGADWKGSVGAGGAAAADSLEDMFGGGSKGGAGQSGSSGSKSSGIGHAWWFWLMIAVLVLLVVVAVGIAVHRSMS